MPRGRTRSLLPTGNLDGKWLDLSSEARRTYVYRDGARYTIEGPRWLNIEKRQDHPAEHRHRVKTADGRCIYVTPGWLAIEWQPADDAADFDF